MRYPLFTVFLQTVTGLPGVFLPKLYFFQSAVTNEVSLRRKVSLVAQRAGVAEVARDPDARGVLRSQCAMEIREQHDGDQAQRWPWNVLGSALRADQACTSVLDHTRARRNFEESQDLMEGVVSEVERSEELAAISFVRQGDAKMNTIRSFELRQANRRKAVVLEALHKWWMVVLRTLRQVEQAEADNSSIPEEFYIRLLVRIARALLEEDDYDEAEVTAEAREDWRRDMRRNSTNGRMERTAFLDGMFELADIWTLSMDAKEYAAFLNRLLSDVLEPGTGVFWIEARAESPPPPPPTLEVPSLQPPPPPPPREIREATKTQHQERKAAVLMQAQARGVAARKEKQPEAAPPATPAPPTTRPPPPAPPNTRPQSAVLPLPQPPQPPPQKPRAPSPRHRAASLGGLSNGVLVSHDQESRLTIDVPRGGQPRLPFQRSTQVQEGTEEALARIVHVDRGIDERRASSTSPVPTNGAAITSVTMLEQPKSVVRGSTSPSQATPLSCGSISPRAMAVASRGSNSPRATSPRPPLEHTAPSHGRPRMSASRLLYEMGLSAPRSQPPITAPTWSSSGTTLNDRTVQSGLRVSASLGSFSSALPPAGLSVAESESARRHARPSSPTISSSARESSWQDLKDHFRAVGEVLHSDGVALGVAAGSSSSLQDPDGRARSRSRSLDSSGLVTFATPQQAPTAIISTQHDPALLFGAVVQHGNGAVMHSPPRRLSTNTHTSTLPPAHTRPMPARALVSMESPRAAALVTALKKDSKEATALQPLRTLPISAIGSYRGTRALSPSSPVSVIDSLRSSRLRSPSTIRERQFASDISPAVPPPTSNDVRPRHHSPAGSSSNMRGVSIVELMLPSSEPLLSAAVLPRASSPASIHGKRGGRPYSASLASMSASTPSGRPYSAPQYNSPPHQSVEPYRYEYSAPQMVELTLPAYASWGEAKSSLHLTPAVKATLSSDRGSPIKNHGLGKAKEQDDRRRRSVKATLDKVFHNLNQSGARVL